MVRCGTVVVVVEPVGALGEALDVAGIEELTVIVVDVSLDAAEHAERTTKTPVRQVFTRQSDVASPHRKSEDETARCSPDQRVVISHPIYGRRSGDPQDGRKCDTTDDSHQDRSDETVGTGDESSDETKEPAHGSCDGQGFERRCV